MNIFEWIDHSLQPISCTSEELIYDDMDSQSGRSLPIVYRPFDAQMRSHWQDRGAILDYLASTGGEGKRLLDFGPGDGWPSLLVAPFSAEVVGVDGSHRRVQVCTENAGRLGLSNTHFIHVPPGIPLPFRDASFDGAMAASSVEQTPDPRATLRELYRVLRPGGRLRVYYEALGRYRGSRERDLRLWDIGEDTCRLLLVDRDIDRGQARQVGLTLTFSSQDVMAMAAKDMRILTVDQLSIPFLERIRPAIRDARTCTLIHPSGSILADWLKQVGFQEVQPTHSGAWFAGQLFDRLNEADRPKDLAGVDALLRPLIPIVAHMAAPLETDPMITAVKTG